MRYFMLTGLDIKHLVYMPVGHVILKIYVPCKNFHLSSQYLYKSCKVYVYSWENKYTPRLKHLPSWAHNHKSFCALRQDLHPSGMRARLNVKALVYQVFLKKIEWVITRPHCNMTVLWHHFLLLRLLSRWMSGCFLGDVRDLSERS